MGEACSTCSDGYTVTATRGGQGGATQPQPLSSENSRDNDSDSELPYSTDTELIDADSYNTAMHHWRNLSSAGHGIGHVPGMTRIVSIGIGDLVTDTATPLDPVTMLPLDMIVTSDIDVHSVPLATESQLEQYATPTKEFGLTGLSAQITHKGIEHNVDIITKTPAVNGNSLMNVSTMSDSTATAGLSPRNEVENQTTFGKLSNIKDDNSNAKQTTKFLQMQEKLSTYAYSTRKIDNLRVFQFRRVALIMQNGHNFKSKDNNNNNEDNENDDNDNDNNDNRMSLIDSGSVSTKPTHLGGSDQDSKIGKRIVPLSIKTRKHGKLMKSKTYESCFIASEMVDWLIKYKYVKTVQDGIKFGNNMLNKKVIECVMTSNKNHDKKFTLANCHKNEKNHNKTDEIAYFQFVMENPLPTIQQLPEIVTVLKQNLKLKDHSVHGNHGKKYKDSFISDDCIEFMIKNFIALNEYNGISIGQLLMDQGYITNAVTKKKKFKKGKIYQFSNPNDHSNNSRNSKHKNRRKSKK